MESWPFGNLDEKPGREWKDEELRQVRIWWMAPDRVRLVWYYAARYLGSGATREDIEDAVVDFFSILDQTRKAYDPSGIPFCDFLLRVCFRNHCIRAGEKIRQRITRETSLDGTTVTGDVFTLQLTDDGAHSDPVQRAQNEAFLSDLSGLLSSDQLPEMQRKAFVLRFLADMSYEEIAAELGAPLGSIKGWLSRATCTVRKYLKERGWGD